MSLVDVAQFARRLRGLSLRYAGGVRHRLLTPNSAALTFDDGPDPVFTPQLLDRLDEADIKATFFLVGTQVERNSAIAQRIYSRGHSVGSHSYSHPVLPTLSSRQIFEELRHGKEAVEDCIGAAVPLFRPPQGYLDIRVVIAIRRLKMQSWLWDINARDYERDASVESIGTACHRMRAGSIVLLHDGLLGGNAPDRSATMQAVPKALEFARQEGLDMIRLMDTQRGKILPISRAHR